MWLGLNGTFGLYRQAATATTVNDGNRQVSINAGDKVFVSFVRVSPHGVVSGRAVRPG